MKKSCFNSRTVYKLCGHYNNTAREPRNLDLQQDYRLEVEILCQDKTDNFVSMNPSNFAACKMKGLFLPAQELNSKNGEKIFLFLTNYCILKFHSV